MTKIIRILAAAAALAVPQAAWPVFDPVNDDTDIFLANPAFASSRPNVLFFIDNTANWSAAVGATSATPKAVSTLSQSGGLATAITAASHGFSTGDRVTIAGASQAEYNGTFTITSTAADAFTFAVAATAVTPATGTITATFSAKTISSLSQSSGTATAVSTNHGFSTGDNITIAGAAEIDYNGTFTITRIDADRFTFAVAATAASPATGSPITFTRVPFDKKFDAVKAGLQAFISGVLTDEFNVGISLFAETGQPNAAYIRYAVRQANSTNKPALVSTVNGMTRTGDNVNNGAFSMGMAEMFTYFAGVSARTGSTTARRDYSGNSTPGGGLASGHAFTSSGSTTYVSPIVDPCQKNFIIMISNGPSTQNADNDATAGFLQTLKGGVAPAQIALSPSGAEGDWSDEYAEFMSNADCNAALDGVQNVYTYTIDILPTTQQQEVQHSALLKSMASKGKGKYFAVTDFSTTDQFTGILKTIFNEVQAVNSVFASTTLPVSVNVRGTNLNQVYIGVFRPDAEKKPRWLGNLKLYRLGVNTANQTLFLADSTGAAAENASTGFITGGAKSFWTASSSYWGFPARTAEQNGVGGANDLPDGDLVEKGGAAQQLRIAYPTDQSTRKLFTCMNAALSGPCTSSDKPKLSDSPFDNTIVSAADIGSFKTYTANTLSSVSNVATLTLAAAPNPTWATGNVINVTGASPDNFNVSNCALTAADNALFTYAFDLTACGKTAPDASTAEATATNHGLQSGDLVEVTGATNTTFNTTTDATVSRITGNLFRYPKTGVAGTNGAITVKGKKLVSALTSLGGTGVIATAVIPSHGYGANGSTVSLTISGATPTEYNNGGSAVTATIVNSDSVTYVVPATISGSGTTGRATSTNHGFTQGKTVYVAGVTPTEYNTPSGAAINVIDANTYTYTLPATATGNGSGTLMRASLRVKFISHANNNDTAQVVLYDTHNWPANTTIVIQGTGGVAPTGYDAPNGTTSGSPWTITNVSGSGWDMTYSATGGNRLRNAPACLRAPGETTFPTGHTSCTTMTADMFAGRLITTLVNAIQATGTIRAAKSVDVSGLSALTTASGTITVGRPNDGDTAARDAIIAWVRGADNRNDENSSTTPAGSDVRPSVHGDVLHSRPAVVNYNRYGDDNDIYAFYGSNDGIFHALKGGTLPHTTAAAVAAGANLIAPGSERWGFIPREFLGRLKRLREQSPIVSNINQKDYFADGSIGIYVKDARGNGDVSSPLNCVPGSCSGADIKSGVVGDNIHATAGDKVYLYMTMRRGGSFMYALDVTKPGPSDVKILWRKSSSDTDWGMLGQTWSEPKIAKLGSLASLGNANNPENVVLIFGAGYDETVEDINPCLLQSSTTSAVQQKAIGSGSVTYTAAGSCTITSPTGSATTISRTKGRGIMIVDAFNGNVVWQAGTGLTTSAISRPADATALKLGVTDMGCAIASDVTVLDKNRDGRADRVYVGDTCGQVWRVDITDDDRNLWTVTKIGAASSSSATDIANKRKFLFSPDLVFGTDTTNYTAVLLGSGDREHPFDTTVVNRFYMFKDRNGSGEAGATNSSSVRIDMTSFTPTGSVVTDADVFDATNAALVSGSDPLGANGWKITLAGGEKVVSSATSVAGTVFFNTNQPSATSGGGSCGSNLGIAREYLVGFADAAATIDLNATGGITIADRSTIHAGGGYLPSPVPVVVEIDGKKYQAVISGTSVQTPPGLTLEKRTRQYWYKEVD